MSERDRYLKVQVTLGEEESQKVERVAKMRGLTPAMLMRVLALDYANEYLLKYPKAVL